MQLSLEQNAGNLYIQSYVPGNIQVNGEYFERSIIVTPKQLIKAWPPQTLPELTLEHLAAIVILQPMVVLLGSGSKLKFPNPAILENLYKQNIGVEVMDTSSACRTFNVLVSEGRNVVAGLLIR